MAYLDVKRKNKNNWWLWLLLVFFALIVVVMWVRSNNVNPSADRVVVDTSADLASHHVNAIVMTEPDWNKIDFNSPEITDQEIKDPNIFIRAGTNYTIYSLGDNILFQKGKKKIQSVSEEKLQSIASLVKKRFDNSYIRVYCRADSVGTPEQNKELGLERANEVKNWLVDEGGVDYKRISVHPVGDLGSSSSNQITPESDHNRNVHIVVFEETK